MAIDVKGYRNWDQESMSTYETMGSYHVMNTLKILGKLFGQLWWLLVSKVTGTGTPKYVNL